MEANLKSIWKTATAEVLVSFDGERLTGEIKQEMKKFEQTIRKRNMGEIGTAIVLIPVFAVIAWLVPPLLAKIGALLIIPYCIMIIVVLKRTQKYQVNDMALPAAEYLERQKAYLLRERFLLANVAYWYISPVILSCSLMFIGFGKPMMIIPGLILGIVIHFINRRAVVRNIDPLLQKVDADLSTLAEETN